jgi:5-methylcytosine-specific restriction protein A
MSVLSDITPKDHKLIIDLVRAAGVDVSDWANFKGGESKASSNPKYCYEWSFVEPKKVVVLNLWFASMQVRDGIVVRDLNMRQIARRFGQIPNGSVIKRRALNMDIAIQKAFTEGLPVRVVVCEGEMRDLSEPKTKASRVHKRLLDEVEWAVTAYDQNNGECTLTRGVKSVRFADQFSIQHESEQQVEQRAVFSHVFVRSSVVRRHVLERAMGKCEWCQQPGFIMAAGSIFLETHHIIPLAENGSDTEDNVVALCPNHHRETHHGAKSNDMRKELLNRRCIQGDLV